MIKNTIKISLAITMSLASIQFACANVFSPASIETRMKDIGLKIIIQPPVKLNFQMSLINEGLPVFIALDVRIAVGRQGDGHDCLSLQKKRYQYRFTDIFSPNRPDRIQRQRFRGRNRCWHLPGKIHRIRQQMQSLGG